MAKKYGTNAADEMIHGTDENDIIDGRFDINGNPVGGNDVLHGMGGDDTIYGSLTGINFLGGQEGNDTIYGGNNADTIRGGEGNDTLYGGAGLYDVINGDDGNDVIYGDAGQDWLSGDAGQDRISGGEGDDFLWGGTGNDTMRGGVGADTLEGGAGHDELYAGLDDGAKDTFKFGADAVGSQSNVWASADYIYEFDAKDEDIVEIDLASGTATVTFQDVGANRYAYVKGDFDGVADTKETIAMSFVGGATSVVGLGNEVNGSDFFYV